MSDLDVFKREHGTAWAKIIKQPAFTSALSLLHNRKLDNISRMSDQEIDLHGKQILGGVRDFLQHENDLLELHRKEDFQLPDEAEEYLSPEQSAEAEALFKRFKADKAKNR